ncbi:MAG: hypothetical protein GWP06_12485 [Actinobacteria bacterium]|nr:hypothetical protein [Actinomycetota bacterium]
MEKEERWAKFYREHPDYTTFNPIDKERAKEAGIRAKIRRDKTNAIREKIFKLRIVRGKSLRFIAEELGMTHQAIWYQIYRIKKDWRFKDRLLELNKK